MGGSCHELSSKANELSFSADELSSTAHELLSWPGRGLADQTKFWAPDLTDGLRLEGAERTWFVSRHLNPSTRYRLLVARCHVYP